MFHIASVSFLASFAFAQSLGVSNSITSDTRQKPALVRREVMRVGQVQEVEAAGAHARPLAFGRSLEATLQYPPHLHNLASFSSVIELTSKTIVISEWHDSEPHVKSWNGRAGNNVVQLMHAIIYAEAGGYHAVDLPPPAGHNAFDAAGSLDHLFDLPPRLFIDANPDLQKRVHCDSTTCKDPKFYWCTCQGTTHTDYRRALMKYLKPKMNNATRTACGAYGHGFRGLTIHLRSGDLLSSSHPQAHFMPCCFHDKVIAAGGFEDVQVITEPDLSHPCLLPLRKQHPKIKVQSKSIQEDACALMTAQHLEYGISTFPLAMAAMNENLKSVSMPGEGNGEEAIPGRVGAESDAWGTLGDCGKPNANSTVAYTLYSAEGVGMLPYGNDSSPAHPLNSAQWQRQVEWMRSSPASSLHWRTSCAAM